MWFPCNFGETIMAKEHMGYELEECKLIGLTNGIFNGGVTYSFKKQRGLFNIDLKDDIAFWPLAFNNDDCCDKSTLHPMDMDLLINIEDSVQYNKYFDTKKTSSGRCISIYLQDDGRFKYTFVGSDNLAVEFFSDKILVRDTDIKPKADPQLSLFQ